MQTAQQISAAEAARRVLILQNPALRGSSQTSNTLHAGLQLIVPGRGLRLLRAGRGAAGAARSACLRALARAERV
jgi:gentisate 1,2-dioxygenase